jgi:hypothetical protein
MDGKIDQMVHILSGFTQEVCGFSSKHRPTLLSIGKTLHKPAVRIIASFRPQKP